MAAAAPVFRGQGNSLFKTDQQNRNYARGQEVPYNVNGSPTGAFVADGDYGDVVVTGSGTTWNFDSSVVTAFARTILDDPDAGTVRATIGAGTGNGTVTTVSVVNANGVSGSVANAGTTPAITLTLGAITPTTVTASGAVSGSNLSGTNTGDQFTAMTSSRFLGRVTAGFGAAEQLTSAQAKTLLAIVMADISDLPTLSHGTYTPTLTAVANIDALVAWPNQYLRVGNVVTVSGRVDIDATAASVLTEFTMTLPISSNFTSQEQGAGTAISSSTSLVVAIEAVIGANTVKFRGTPTTANSRAHFFTFTYSVI